jgi:protein TonB
MFARIAIALPLGVTVTAGLLFMMHLFIQTGHGQSESDTLRVVDFVRVERSEVVEVRESRPEKPEAREPAPDLSQPQSTEGFSTGLGVSVAKPSVDFKAEISGIAMTASDGEYLPIVKVAPRYPVRALQRRLEGFVIVEFVVTTSGAVRDVQVIESSSEVFEEAAIEAALKFKYKPRVVDGIAIEVAGVQNRISFKLDA